MNAQDFAYWLQGFVELTDGQTPNPGQWKSICEHLELVFKKVTPPLSMPSVVPTQTGPIPGTPDPSAGKDWQEYFRQFQHINKWPAIHPGIVTC